MSDLGIMISEMIGQATKATSIIKASVETPPPNLTIKFDGQVIPSEQIYCSNYLLPHYHRDYTIDGIIDKIEIITNPSAKYDAAGNTGLINIKLKKKLNTGFDANISSTSILRTKASVNNALTLNYSNEELILNYNLFYGDENRNFENKNKLLFTDEQRESVENTERIDKGLSHQLNADYQLVKAINLGFML